MDLLILILELIGTAAFAVSGATVAAKKNMDVFGVAIMGIVTACGGGVLRDLFLAVLPPTMFTKPVYPLTAIAVSILVFGLSFRRKPSHHPALYELTQTIADALGLGVFTAVGCVAGIRAGYGDNMFFTAFLGVITGVGGGVFRDVLAGIPPSIFVRHIYALASIAGAILCCLIARFFGTMPAVIICTVVVTAIRIFAAGFRWSLPHAGLPKSEDKN
ncbi:MAG: TRIC cation channel family protein [Lachnospiraceae bacterium]|nr:TRIC cation channel family protein [Lachnospiraceae bacterium]